MTQTPTDVLRLVPTRDDGLRVGRAILEAHSQWEKEHGVTGAQTPWQEQHITLLGQAAILAAPASPLPGGGDWGAIRNAFVRHADSFVKASRYEEASAIADKAAREIQDLMSPLPAAPTGDA